MDASELAPGMRFGRYQLHARLGGGAMGDVWRAVHLSLKKPVALKVLRPEISGDLTARNRFVREGEAASRIRHPHVVDVYDAGECEGVPFLAMELLEGETLADKFEREGALPVTEIAEVMLPVLAAVSAAHREGIIHRDLKPENIFLARGHDWSLLPKVLDFGISRVVNDRSGRVRTQANTVLGTPQYMAPEQARAEPAIDDRSDQYALGAILYEAATGVPAFRDEPLYKLLGRVAAGEFRAPREVRPEVSGALEAVIVRAMALDPQRRFRSLRSMGASLLPLASERVKALWATTFDPHEARVFDATLVDECSGPSWGDSNATLVDAPTGHDTLRDHDEPPSRAHEREMRAETVVIEPVARARRPVRIAVLAVIAVVAVAAIVVTVAQWGAR